MAGYFIPDGRSDMEYCSRPLSNQPEKTCQDIGEMVRLQKKIKNDPIFMEYNFEWLNKDRKYKKQDIL